MGRFPGAGSHRGVRAVNMGQHQNETMERMLQAQASQREESERRRRRDDQIMNRHLVHHTNRYTHSNTPHIDGLVTRTRARVNSGVLATPEELREVSERLARRGGNQARNNHGTPPSTSTSSRKRLSHCEVPNIVGRGTRVIAKDKAELMKLPESDPNPRRPDADAIAPQAFYATRKRQTSPSTVHTYKRQRRPNSRLSLDSDYSVRAYSSPSPSEEGGNRRRFSSPAYKSKGTNSPSNQRRQQQRRTKPVEVEPEPEPKPPMEPIHVLSDQEEEESDRDESDNDDDFRLIPSGSGPNRRQTRLSNRLNAARSDLPKLLKNLRYTFKSDHRKGASISICAQDIQSLQDSEFVNDTVIDYYINYLLDKIHEGGGSSSACLSSDDVFIFSTFFYKKLTSKAHMHDKMEKWTKNVDLFSRKYVFIPVCSNLHWSLALVCNKRDYKDGKLDDIQVSIIHVDSMYNGHCTSNITKVLRRYLESEWHRSLGDESSICHQVAKESTIYTNGERKFSYDRILGGRIKSPKQNNFCDCGLFLLKFIQKFLFQPPESLEVLMVKSKFTVNPVMAPSEKSKAFKDWFTVADANALRRNLRLRLVENIADNNPGSERAEKVKEIVLMEREKEDISLIEETDLNVEVVNEKRGAKQAKPSGRAEKEKEQNPLANFHKEIRALGLGRKSESRKYQETGNGKILDARVEESSLEEVPDSAEDQTGGKDVTDEIEEVDPSPSVVEATPEDNESIPDSEGGTIFGDSRVGVDNPSHQDHQARLTRRRQSFVLEDSEVLELEDTRRGSSKRKGQSPTKTVDLIDPKLDRYYEY